MSTIKVSVESKPIFVWEGGEVEAKHVLEDFPHLARREGLRPTTLAVGLINILREEGKLLSTGAEPQTMQVTAVIWYILTRNPEHSKHPGKFGDYVGVHDLDVDFQFPSKRKLMLVVRGTPKPFDA
jgi:hypothetical protein